MPRTLSSTEYTELGKRYYGGKEYQKALDAFTEAIEASTGTDITLFDYRAATWEKLQELPKALAEARRMIKAGKGDARGYLRTAQILQKMKKPDVALSIYEYGLRNIPVSTNPHLKLLQDAHDKLNRQLSPPTAVDPLSVLPVELVVMIVGYLRFYEIVNCLRVSKEWKAFITSAPSLWSNLDLVRKNNQKFVRSQTIRSCIKYSQYKIHTARLHRFSDRAGLRSLTTTCKSLANLEFLQTEFGGDTIIETVMIARSLKTLKISAAIDLDVDQISQILKHRPTLASLQVDSVKLPRIATSWQVDLPGLEVLNLRMAERPANPPHILLLFLANLNMPNFIQRTPNLKELHLTRFSGMPLPVFDLSSLDKLEVLELRDCTLQAPPILPPSIRELTLLEITARSTSFRGFQFQSSLPKLEKLRVYGLEFDYPEVCRLLDGFDDGSKGEIVETPKKLKMLGLTGSYTELWQDAGLELTQVLTHPRVRNIEELILNIQSDFVIDDWICTEVVAGTFKKLRSLDLSGTWVTGVGVKAIVTAMKSHLRWLDVSLCRHLGLDAVEWARKEGIDVIYRRESEFKAAKDARRIIYRE